MDIRKRRQSIYFRSWSENLDGSISGPFGKVVSTTTQTSTFNNSSIKLSVAQAYQSAKLADLSILGNLKRELDSLDRDSLATSLSYGKYGRWLYSNCFCC